MQRGSRCGASLTTHFAKRKPTGPGRNGGSGQQKAPIQWGRGYLICKGEKSNLTDAELGQSTLQRDPLPRIASRLPVHTTFFQYQPVHTVERQ